MSKINCVKSKQLLTFIGVVTRREEDDLRVVRAAGPGLRGVDGSSTSSVVVSNTDVSANTITKIILIYIYIDILIEL